jgi:hypothetical protein
MYVGTYIAELIIVSFLKEKLDEYAGISTDCVIGPGRAQARALPSLGFGLGPTQGCQIFLGPNK